MDAYDYAQVEMLRKWNDTYNSRMHKYTLNLPEDLFLRAQKKAREAGIYRVSIFFRAIIEREVEGTTSLGINDIIASKKESERIARSDHNRDYFANIEKSRRGLGRFMKMFQPKQQLLDFKK